MQTKEGAAALFSMAVANEAISRFTDVGGKVLIIGYGDCTGGAQASFVTHPAVDNYYLSGANIPFAGQIVVPEHLSLQGTLSNYLRNTLIEETEALSGHHTTQRPAAMRGLIKHPFGDDLDHRLRAIDPDIPVGELSLPDLLQSWTVSTERAVESPSIPGARKLFAPIKQVLIHARGCTALRLIQAAQGLGRSVVLVQSDPDMHSAVVSYLRESDRLVCLGGQSSDESYLNASSVLRVAQLEEVDALHPGIGFLSENASFAEQCLSQGLNFIGPDSNSIAQMGDKSRAIATAIAANVPVVPGSHGLVASLSDARRVMSEIGLPLLIKASHGGGGKGIGTVETEAALIDTYNRVKQEAASAFACDDIYIERLLENVRHIEVQVLRDHKRNFRMLGVRDCSIQRNRQKIIEESGEYVLQPAQLDSLRDWGGNNCQTVSIISAREH